MEVKLLSWSSARQISIVKLLEEMEIRPARQSSSSAFYLSPLREETEPSFCVSLQKNLWYDFGLAQGGNVVDLVIQLKSCSPMEARRYLSGQNSFFFNPPVLYKDEEKDAVQVLAVKGIQHPAVIQYLDSRNISVSTASFFCSEVWYRYKGQTYFSMGILNSEGGWELRNKFFKNSTTPKSYSLTAKGKEKLLLFEGMFDLLSLATIDQDLIDSSDCLVLNSLGFLQHIFPLLKRYRRICCYLDNDPAGKKATQKLMEFSMAVTDCSTSYRGYKDLNEKLMLQRQQF